MRIQCGRLLAEMSVAILHDWESCSQGGLALDCFHERASFCIDRTKSLAVVYRQSVCGVGDYG